jgi:hypothetical protein
MRETSARRLNGEKIANFNHLRGTAGVGNAQITCTTRLPHRTLDRPVDIALSTVPA